MRSCTWNLKYLLAIWRLCIISTVCGYLERGTAKQTCGTCLNKIKCTLVVKTLFDILRSILLLSKKCYDFLLLNLECCKCAKMRFTAQMAWWFCAVAHLRGNTGHRSYVVCSQYIGALTISWKICLLFGQHTVDCVSHKSPHKHHSLHMPGFGVLKLYVMV